jgi:hypothetical protein
MRYFPKSLSQAQQNKPNKETYTMKTLTQALGLNQYMFAGMMLKPMPLLGWCTYRKYKLLVRYRLIPFVF